MRPKVVIWGASGQARVVADIFRLRGDYELVGFLDDVSPERIGTSFCEARILGGREQLDPLRDQGVHFMILGFGNNAARLKLAGMVRAKGYQLATALHPQAVVAAGVTIGAGTVIKAGACIDPDVTIGENVIVGSCVCVGHGCVLKDGARLSAGASLAGRITIGVATMIGTGAALRDGIHVGDYTLVGAGSTVVKDIPGRVVAYGSPARVIRRVTPD